MSSPLAKAATVHQAPWASGSLPGSPRTIVEKLAVLDKALLELRGSQTHELAKASSVPGGFDPERDAWLRRAIDAVERYRGHLARRAVSENDQEAVAHLSPADIEVAGEALAKASFAVGLSGRPGLARRPRLR